MFAEENERGVGRCRMSVSYCVENRRVGRVEELIMCGVFIIFSETFRRGTFATGMASVYLVVH